MIIFIRIIVVDLPSSKFLLRKVPPLFLYLTGLNLDFFVRLCLGNDVGRHLFWLSCLVPFALVRLYVEGLELLLVKHPLIDVQLN